MSVIQFRDYERKPRKGDKPPCDKGQIVIFPGVRYEHTATPQARKKLQLKKPRRDHLKLVE